MTLVGLWLSLHVAGTDGHTASLFPWQASLRIKQGLVIYSTGRPQKEDQPVERRMTLTFTAINNARHVSVLVTGKKKQEILQAINTDDPLDPNQYPILSVVPKGTMTWYIDNKAYELKNPPT